MKKGGRKRNMKMRKVGEEHLRHNGEAGMKRGKEKAERREKRQTAIGGGLEVVCMAEVKQQAQGHIRKRNKLAGAIDSFFSSLSVFNLLPPVAL
ncbi:hypothetical protein ATANTOWER_031333 [Ataeniobius toweri]|uniref:Small EDRK-rich factor-like N-terminal domain-containing protein n=1 Tax=Ataeniobius toweri TaxID=208326 RepID=A0ABU7CH90_9TELE|nr:hypothetical protein [Ataeniobius toweri]